MARYAHMPEGTVAAIYDRDMEQTVIAGHVVKGKYLAAFTPDQLTALSLVKIVRAIAPIFDPLTERLALVPCAIGATEALDTWIIVALTPEEQQAVQDRLAEEQRIADLRADALYQDLISKLIVATPQQINDYVESNANNTAGMRGVLKRMLLVQAGMLKE